jgi:Flp pilus assembly protein TadD
VRPPPTCEPTAVLRSFFTTGQSVRGESQVTRFLAVCYLVSLVAIAGCKTAPPPTGPIATIYTAKEIVTLDPNAPSAEALAVEGDRIIATGSLAAVEQALANLQVAIKANPKHPTPYDQLGSIMLEQGRFAEAESNYRHFVRIHPSADAHMKLADVLTKLGRTSEAREEMEIAKALGKKS